jgi:hypothetical protein
MKILVAGVFALRATRTLLVRDTAHRVKLCPISHSPRLFLAKVRTALAPQQPWKQLGARLRVPPAALLHVFRHRRVAALFYLSVSIKPAEETKRRARREKCKVVPAARTLVVMLSWGECGSCGAAKNAEGGCWCLRHDIECRLSLLTGNSLVTALIVWAILVFGVCMLLFMLLAPDQLLYLFGIRQIPTLSLSGAFQPGEAIFTLGLHWLSVMSVVFFFLIYQKNQRHILSVQAIQPPPVTRVIVCCCFVCPLEGPALHRVNSVLLLFGLGFSFFMALVGTIPLSLNENGHGTVAILMF